MGQLKHYNELTGQWEPTIAGAQGPQGPQGVDGYVGEDGLPGIVAQSGEPDSTDILWLDTDEDGVGIPLGGTAGQVLAKVDSGDFNTEWVSPLSQSDIDSALEDYYTGAQIDTALGDYYTAAEIDTTLQDYYTSAEVDTSFQDYYTISQTDSVISSAISDVVDTAPAMLDTLNELSAALNDDPNFATTVANALAALVPSGTISQTARATAPTGYLLCDGSAISRTTYSALFDAIGTAYGSGDGSTTFNIPNLKGRVPVGYDPSQSEFDSLGEIGGKKAETLDVTQIPSHTHSGTTGNQSQNHTHAYSGTVSGSGAHNHLFYMDDGAAAHATRYNNTGNYDATSNNASGNGGFFWTPGGNSAYDGTHSHTYSGTTAGVSQDHTHSFTTDGTGGGQAHNNLQPYVVLNYMIKI